MSSPMSSTQKAPGEVFRSNDTEKYRQAVYHDGAGRRIAECRRRSKRDPSVQSTPSVHGDWVLYPTEGECTVSESRPGGLSSHTTSTSPSPKNSGLAKHVTSAKLRSNRAKSKFVVVLDSRVATTATEDKKTPFPRDLADLTPPPTPRLERLATPDLSDLDQRPFCDCAAERDVLEICVSCRLEIEPRME